MLAQNIQNQKLIDILLNDHILSQDNYNLVKNEQINTGRDEEDIILEKKLVSEDNLVRAKSKLYNIPFVDIKDLAVNPQALSFIPRNVAERFIVFPYAYNNQTGNISVVMQNPLDVNAIDFLEQKSQKSITPFFGLENDIKDMITQKYAQGLSYQIDEALKETDQKEVIDEKSINEVIREAPIAKIVTTIMNFAVKVGASDIHIEALEDKTRVRYRIDGILYEKLVLPKNVHEALISRIKILSRMKIDEKRIPQDGRFAFKTKNEEVDLRVSTLPSVHGEKIVMRLLKKGGEVPELSDLGIRGRALKNLEEAIKATHGVVLITGPTGSGKTTTLYSILHKINTSKVNIMTLEDPVEYEMEGVNQVQINPAAGLTFSSGLRSFLRQDPNVIMVGEIRDSETAELAIQAALTGHLVFSTLHTNSSAGALPRLIDMEVEPFLLASAINCIVGQRIVRKICSHCKEGFNPPMEAVMQIKEVLGSLFTQFENKEIQLFKGKGCSFCNDTGYSGRLGIYEVMPVSEKISTMAISKEPASAIERQAVESGMLTMKMDGFLKILEGSTTIEEVLRVAQE
ncbi:type II/IV secretion system protein [Candidatus Beckwithbacteria bacterium]|nr:type II/IV secretion system protein [Candidatus Beckwithbacteria bacterium]